MDAHMLCQDIEDAKDSAELRSTVATQVEALYSPVDPRDRMIFILVNRVSQALVGTETLLVKAAPTSVSIPLDSS
jgi:hypothetical protein